MSFPIAATLLGAASANAGEHCFKIVTTTDVHGNYYPYNFITGAPASGSLSRVAAHVKELRHRYGAGNVIVLDNGDILQGQPTAYYYNFIDTVSRHVVPRMLQAIGYDAANMGNHDVETGHAVYDRYRSELQPIPLLGANIVNRSDGKPYMQPYTVFERDGVKFAVLGMITPAIPAWLPENLWSGLEFEDMVEAARKWVPYIKEKENPDVLIGLFHSGHDSSRHTGQYLENASLEVARQVPGLDVVFLGHDHQILNVTAPTGALVLDSGSLADNVAEVTVCISKDADGHTSKSVNGEVVNISAIQPDAEFEAQFGRQRKEVSEFVGRRIGEATGDFSERDAYFGPSAFMELLHSLQLEISGADISLAAPLSFDALIKKGPLTMSDMFKLYKYENMLYTMELTGQEIKDYLEFSYDLWTKPVSKSTDQLLRFAEGAPAKGDYAKLQNPAYNFDSAAGIIYDVDVRKPRGSKITIRSMADGKPFDPKKRYRVALNSYRGNGGGDHLTQGAGIPASELPKRLVSATDKDLRYYLIKAVERRGTITPTVAPTWRFVPATLATPAADNSRKMLFGE